jgi:hypothetical protein
MSQFTALASKEDREAFCGPVVPFTTVENARAIITDRTTEGGTVATLSFAGYSAASWWRVRPRAARGESWPLYGGSP